MLRCSSTSSTQPRHLQTLGRFGCARALKVRNVDLRRHLEAIVGLTLGTFFFLANQLSLATHHLKWTKIDFIVLVGCLPFFISAKALLLRFFTFLFRFHTFFSYDSQCFLDYRWQLPLLLFLLCLLSQFQSVPHLNFLISFPRKECNELLANARPATPPPHRDGLWHCLLRR